MDQHSTPQPKDPIETASQDQEARPEHDIAQSRSRARSGDAQSDDRFDQLLAEIAEAMGDDWPVRRDGSLRRFR